jgi:hypothetical protein
MLKTIDHEAIMTWSSTLAVLAICALGMFGLVAGWSLTKSDSMVGKIFGGAITTLSFFPLILGSLGLFLLAFQLVAADAGWIKKDTSLSQVAEVIHIDGDKVTIDKLPQDIEYKSYRLKGDTKQIFKFERDDYYERGYLIDHDGHKYELNSDDTNYLKERSGK